MMLAVLVAAFACEKKNDNNGDPVAVTDVSLNQTSATLTTGGTLTLVATVEPDDATVKTVEWESSNPTVATVLSSGLVTAIAPGSATIMVVTDDGNKTATCALTVNPIVVADVWLSPATVILTPGNTMTLTVTVLPDNATNRNVAWTSSSTATATVDNTGKVTAVALGSATITVTTADGGHTATCDVQVMSDKVIAGGVEWATRNVDDYQTFAACPDMYTKFYQWNRPTAWPATGEVVTGWLSESITDPVWTINPCPAGWRVPTEAEWSALAATGNTWADAGTRGAAVAGGFFGSNHTTCSLPSNMSGCIFLPAVGRREYINGVLYNQGSEGWYWSSTQYPSNTNYGYFWYFYSGYSSLTSYDKAFGNSVRCVREVE